MVQSRSTAGGKGARSPFAVPWDLDGVLVDTSRYHYEAWRRVMAECGRGRGSRGVSWNAGRLGPPHRW